MKKKIYFYDELVRSMESEFKQRVAHKRATIKKMKQRHKEYALTEATLVCERCMQDIAPVKTFECLSQELHHAKCVFGTLQRVEMGEVGLYPEDADFVEIYKDEFPRMHTIINPNSTTMTD